MNICELIEMAAKEYAQESSSSEKASEKAEYDFKQGCIYLMKLIIEMKISHEEIMIEC